jgi:renalase
MMDFCILGSGISGSTIANLLSKKYSVEVFDKARGPGGRASNRRFKSNLSFDHGLSYITPVSKNFEKFITNLNKKKVLKIWKGQHIDFSFKKKSSTEAKKFIGKKSNSDISKYQLKKIKQNYFSKISKIKYKNKIWEITLDDKRKIEFKALIITCPYPQLKQIAKKYIDQKLLNLNIKMEPVITLMLAVKSEKIIPISSIKFNDSVISFAINENSKKRFNSKLNLWTLHSSIQWAKKNINIYKNNTKTINELKYRFMSLTKFKNRQIAYSRIHGWKFSYNLTRSLIKSSWNKKINLGVCGDWFIGPKAEDAWCSALDLSKKIKKNPLKK